MGTSELQIRWRTDGVHGNGARHLQSNAQHLLPLDTFARRHLGPDGGAVEEMLKTVGVSTLDELIDETVPAAIRMRGELQIPGPRAKARC